MPLISLGKNSNTNVLSDLPPPPAEKMVISSEIPNRVKRGKAIVNKQISTDHILVVNGKEKKIGKKSQYLLDMLIIEE
tara:strand:- start:1162 stop:1395 length:234 start_codon:yes stop_codon:yes gene_type:complete